MRRIINFSKFLLRKIRIHPAFNTINGWQFDDTLCMRVLVPFSACPFFSRHQILHTGCWANRYATCSEQTANGRTDGSSVFARAEIPVGLSPYHPVCYSSSTPDVDNGRRSYKAESFATTDTDTRIGCCENDIANSKQAISARLRF